jgi:hypothetical protein
MATLSIALPHGRGAQLFKVSPAGLELGLQIKVVLQCKVLPGRQNLLGSLERFAIGWQLTYDQSLAVFLPALRNLSLRWPTLCPPASLRGSPRALFRPLLRLS